MNIPKLLRSFLEICPEAGSQELGVYVMDDNGDLAPIGGVEEYEVEETGGPGVCLHFTNPRAKGRADTMLNIWKKLLKFKDSALDVSVGRTMKDGSLEVFAIYALSTVTRPDGSKALLVMPEEY